MTGMVEGKVALVTGAGRGVGAEIAKMLGAHGAQVIVNDPGGAASGEGADRTPALQTVSAIRDAGGEAEANFDSVAEHSAAQGDGRAGDRVLRAHRHRREQRRHSPRTPSSTR